MAALDTRHASVGGTHLFLVILHSLQIPRFGSTWLAEPASTFLPGVLHFPPQRLKLAIFRGFCASNFWMMLDRADCWSNSLHLSIGWAPA